MDLFTWVVLAAVMVISGGTGLWAGVSLGQKKREATKEGFEHVAATIREGLESHGKQLIEAVKTKL
jgi:hypothetical protein